MSARTRSPYDKAPSIACGVFSLTPAAEFPLRPICRLPRIPFAELLDQPGEFQQISHAEERLLSTDDNLGIRRHEIRPLRWNRADGRLINVQQEPSAIPVIPLAYTRQLLAAERMEWVRDAYKTRRCICTTCILD
jgi:hypothetical protein